MHEFDTKKLPKKDKINQPDVPCCAASADYFFMRVTASAAV
jgi:hypothetical protein